jgi:UDP-GlcNAc:undecaprenyl-phosphate/decaprenyl-phosphate GlcNAc-1-phosphate transferase
MGANGELILFAGFITALFVVLISMPSLIKVAKLKHLVDEPSEHRKIHHRSVPTIGGIVIFGAIVFSYALWFPDKYDHLNSVFTNFKFLIASLIVLFFVGVKDDIIGTAAVKKLLSHFLVGFILVVMGGIQIKSMHGIFGVYELVEWQSIILSIFAYIVIVNAYNLIDGVDGLAGGIGLMNALFFGIWFYLTGNVPLGLLSFVLAGALLGFLFFNFSPAKIFMGDSGSLVIGAIISVLAITMINEPSSRVREDLWIFSNIPTPVYAMAVLVYPLLDTLRVFTIRIIRGQSPLTADNNHIHHRLLQRGFSHKGVCFGMYIYNIVVVIASAFIASKSATISFVSAFVLAFVLISPVFLPTKRKSIE